jgi:ribosome recycling factor
MEKALVYLRMNWPNFVQGKPVPICWMVYHVDYYGANTPLNQVSNINTPDPRTIIVQPWEKKYA